MLRHLSGCTKLGFLRLEGTQIDGSGLAAIATLTGLRGIQLSESLIENEHLGILGGFPSLWYVGLARCPNIDDDGLAYLIACCPDWRRSISLEQA